MEPFVSRDGRYLLWNSDEADNQKDIYYAERVRPDLFTFRGPVQGVNTPFVDGTPSLTRDGTLYFVSNRDYKPKEGKYRSVYRGRFENGVVTEVELVPGNLDSELTKPGWIMMGALVSGDGNTLYLSKAQFKFSLLGAGVKQADFSIARRQGDRFIIDSDAKALLRNINTERHLEYAGTPSPDLLTLYFTRLERNWLGQPRTFTIMRATRPDTQAPYGLPVIIPEVSDGFVEAPALSPDGRALYYHKKDGKRFALYLFRLTPE